MKKNVPYQKALSSHNRQIDIGFLAIGAGFAYIMLATASDRVIWPGVVCAIFGPCFMVWSGIRLERKAPVIRTTQDIGPGVL